MKLGKTLDVVYVEPIEQPKLTQADEELTEVPAEVEVPKGEEVCVSK